ncbi:hypothetical protein V6N13_046969 [Hibiscus sabdariffa]|uniref:Uncharacterized protein n=2 Tax=Hibiscus sabdariffa TaxID=183260 RepID=A0ABR2CA23_9ROSI
MILRLCNNLLFCVAGENEYHMDSKAPSNVIDLELARELLIAISYTVPDTYPRTDHASRNVDDRADGPGNYRSEPISKPYDIPSDAQVPPVLLETHVD